MSGVKPVFVEDHVKLTVTVVIVLYRIAPAQSPAFQSVMSARTRLNSDAGEVRVLLWDNSPEPATMGELSYGDDYFHDPSNSGLAKAYNRAL